MSSRVLRDDLWTSERVNALHDKTFRLYLALVSAADDYGLVSLSYGDIRRAAPLLNWPREEAAKMLGELVDACLINPYEDAGKPFAAMQNWQSYVRTVKPRYPVPSFGMGHCRMPYGFKTVKVRNAASLFLKHLDIERVSPGYPQGIPSAPLGNVGSKGVGDFETLGVREKEEKNKPKAETAPEPDTEPTAGADRFPNCPIQKIQTLYHELLPMLPKVLVGNPTRDAHIRARWQQIFAEGHADTDEDGIQFFRDYFSKVAKSKFLIGQGNPRDGRKPFRADLLWLVNQTNFAKVIERGYA